VAIQNRVHLRNLDVRFFRLRFVFVSLLTPERPSSHSYLESLAGSDTADAAASALAAASAATAGAKASPAAAAAAAAAAAGEGAAYMPRLFSFLSAEGHGVEAYFHGQYLLIEASGGAGCVSLVSFSPPGLVLIAY
jgi:hypothetical protein